MPLCCGARRNPNLQIIFKAFRVRTGKRPIIVIPGLLGSELINQRTGEVVWPALRRCSDDELDLPVTPDLAANRDDLLPRFIIDNTRFVRILPKVSFFHELLDLLRLHGGYKEGDCDNPTEDGDHDTFYVFAYDWRRDTVETAREFVNRVKSLKTKLGSPDLRFNLITPSNGGLVARYAAMYGDTDLAPEGVTPVPTWAGAGTSKGSSCSALLTRARPKRLPRCFTGTRSLRGQAGVCGCCTSFRAKTLWRRPLCSRFCGTRVWQNSLMAS